MTRPTDDLRDDPCRPRHYRPPASAPVPPEGPAQDAIELSHTRLLITGALFLLAFIVIGARLVEVAGFKAGDVHFASSRAAAKPLATRADIVDRNGVLLATTLDAPSLFANPKLIDDKRGAARKLAAILPKLTESEIYERLNSDKSFVWLDRRLTPRQENAVNRLGIAGLQFQGEGKRVYPEGHLTAHVVGYVGVDDNGLAGIERSFDQTLMRGDQPVPLSLDVRLQYILRSEIARQMTEFKAIGAAGVIMDVRDGEVLALVSLPDFDPADPGAASPAELFNRAALGTYEMGSVLKIFNTAMVLDDRVATLGSSFDATKPLQVGRFVIHDYEPKKRWLTVPEIFEYSSNIGSARMAAEAGADRQRAFFTRLDLLHAPAFELPEGTPLYPNPWRPINVMTIAFGHGVSISPLQLAAGASAVVNGGVYYPPTVIKRTDGTPPNGHRVISATTSTDMRRLMRLVVEGGTGRLAGGSGYLIGGKTGTAEKDADGHYETHKLLSSFLGVFPINDPRFLVLVMLDEPHGDVRTSGFATGGMVAAPAVKRIVMRMAPIVGIPPIDQNSPEIRRSLMVGLPNPQGRKLAAN
ncbi:MAG: penicillin-binding protein 2 [Alphaproteobacteria bacterium]|nr:penicillin-binding protein 2 [Alphaproteobacteria bacterium]